MNRLPPGQIATRRFPVVGERSPSADLEADSSIWSLRIEGEVDNPVELDLDRFRNLPHRELRFDIHCVTSWTRFDSVFSGIPLSKVLDLAGVRESARFASFVAYSERDHHTSLPLDVAMRDAWLVDTFEGEPLTTEHGGPVRVVTPGRYFYKSLKWVRRIDLLAADRLGWWEETSAYHNNADPATGAERFTTGSLRPTQLERFLSSRSYDKYRNRVMLGLDLRSWQPGTKDLSRLHLKNCDLRGVEMPGADLRASNLSLSDLRGANLAGADLSGSDLEGANFSGADLTDADLSHTALSATRFADNAEAARVLGISLEGAWGLVEDQEEFLRSCGAV